MNKKFYIVLYPNYINDEYKIAKKTFTDWKKASNFKKKVEYYTETVCSLIALHCTEEGIFRTIQNEIQNKA